MKRVEFKIEFVIRSSPTILYNFVSTPSGMAQWFADHVDVNEGIYSFFWDGNEETAKLVDKEDGIMVKYQWTDEDEAEFFQFSIEKVDVTNDTVLVVTAYADDKFIDDERRYWESLIKTLTIQIGGG